MADGSNKRHHEMVLELIEEDRSVDQKELNFLLCF